MACRVCGALLFVITVAVRRSREHVEGMRSDDRVGNGDTKDGPAAIVECVDCPEYVGLTAKEKTEVLFKKVSSDEYEQLPHNWPDLLAVNFKDLRQCASNGTMSYSFNRFSDENPTEHAKVIHTFGSVGTVRVEAVPNALGLTGLFESGTENAVIRLSIVADWTKPCKGGTDGNFNGCFKPSMALKALRNGTYSSNLLAQANLGDGVGRNFNFFSINQGTWLPTPYGVGAEVVKVLFSYGASPSNAVGVMEWATKGALAHETRAEIKAPKLVYFVPHADVAQKFKFSSNEHDVREDFAKIDVGTTLYDMVVPTKGDCFQNPPWYEFWKGTDPVPALELNQENCPHTVVARIVTTSRLVASAWGDRRLFFQHERIDKGGKWKRKLCEHGASLPAQSEYRMPSDFHHTFTNACSDSKMIKCSGSANDCPFENLES